MVLMSSKKSTRRFKSWKSKLQNWLRTCREWTHSLNRASPCHTSLRTICEGAAAVERTNFLPRSLQRLQFTERRQKGRWQNEEEWTARGAPRSSCRRFFWLYEGRI